MEMWTLTVWGLVAVPTVGLVAVLADLVDAYRDLIYVQLVQPPDPVAAEQAKHTMWAQVARAVVLLLIVNIAMWEITGLIDKHWLAVFVYAVALVGVADAWRSRRSRKRMIALLDDRTEN